MNNRPERPISGTSRRRRRLGQPEPHIGPNPLDPIIIGPGTLSTADMTSLLNYIDEHQDSPIIVSSQLRPAQLQGQADLTYPLTVRQNESSESIILRSTPHTPPPIARIPTEALRRLRSMADRTQEQARREMDAVSRRPISSPEAMAAISAEARIRSRMESRHLSSPGAFGDFFHTHTQTQHSIERAAAHLDPATAAERRRQARVAASQGNDINYNTQFFSEEIIVTGRNLPIDSIITSDGSPPPPSYSLPTFSGARFSIQVRIANGYHPDCLIFYRKEPTFAFRTKFGEHRWKYHSRKELKTAVKKALKSHGLKLVIWTPRLIGELRTVNIPRPNRT
jgi:hypothetical protein